MLTISMITTIRPFIWRLLGVIHMKIFHRQNVKIYVDDKPSSGQAKIVNELVESGANVNVAKADGPTPLHIAADGGFTEQDQVNIIETLLNHGANPELVDKNGKTALDLATKSGKLD